MTDTKDPHPRAIDLTIEIRSSLDDVWQALTTGEGLANWFPPEASATPGPGGSLTFSWGAGEDWVAPIVVWEPNVRLGIANETPAEDGGTVRLAVDFHLESRGGTVIVRLVHSGFDDSERWDDFIDGLTAGWSYFLINLRHALERHPGTRRVMVSARPACRGSVVEGQQIAFGPGGLDVHPDVAALTVGQTCSVRLGDEPFRAIVVMSSLPRAVGFAIPALNDALLFVEREGLKLDYRLGLWLSLYDVPADRVTALRRSVESLGAKIAMASGVSA
jgi:uncharacterized protein YndB with AHSA1/START domain